MRIEPMQEDYKYALTEPCGELDFPAQLTPRQMLEMGVFEGKYMNDCRGEFPDDWFEDAKLSGDGSDVNCNYFKIKSRQPLYIWKRNGWIYGNDPRGWFQWYCRYFMGRREPEVDAIQIGRWKAFGPRHIGGIKSDPKYKKAQTRADRLKVRPKQRQALLQWAYDPFV